MPTMSTSSVRRYLTPIVYQVCIRPVRKWYRFLFRPKLRGVKAVVFNKQRVLLVRPNYAHRLWTFPGGGLRNHESFEDAARREAKEETGVDLEALTFVREYETMHDGCTNTVRVYSSHTDMEDIEVDGIEIKEAGWFPLDALPHDRVPRVDGTLAALSLPEKP